jgi:ATP-dependent Zn protease
MVWRYGMGEDGHIGDYSAIPESMLSEDVKKQLNAEVASMLQKCLKQVEELLTAEWDIVTEFANALLEKEELDYDEIEEIFIKHGKSNALIKIKKD